jgi:hypothetical protein
MPTTVHIPSLLLERLDQRARAEGISRNKLIVRTLRQAIDQDDSWSPEFISALRGFNRSDELDEAVEELQRAIAEGRTSKGPPEL